MALRGKKTVQKKKQRPLNIYFHSFFELIYFYKSVDLIDFPFIFYLSVQLLLESVYIPSKQGFHICVRKIDFYQEFSAGSARPCRVLLLYWNCTADHHDAVVHPISGSAIYSLHRSLNRTK